MVMIDEEVAKKLERFREEGEGLDNVIKRMIEVYEEFSDYIDEKWEKLRRDKDKFVDLEEYASSRRL